jgi:20S proteasome subunit beta 6
MFSPDKRMTAEEAENCIHDAFVSAAERHIQVGDAIHFKIVTKHGVEEKIVALRKD